MRIRHVVTRSLRSMEEAPSAPERLRQHDHARHRSTPCLRKVMDHRVLEHYRGDITQVNIAPKKRAKILAAYGVNAMNAYICPICDYTYTESTGAARERLSARHTVGRAFRTTGAARLRCPREGRLHPRHAILIELPTGERKTDVRDCHCLQIVPLPPVRVRVRRRRSAGPTTVSSRVLAGTRFPKTGLALIVVLPKSISKWWRWTADDSGQRARHTHPS